MDVCKIYTARLRFHLSLSLMNGTASSGNIKWSKTAESALEQIKEKCYPKALKDYSGNILLVGINYDERTKEHSCKIEPYSL